MLEGSWYVAELLFTSEIAHYTLIRAVNEIHFVKTCCIKAEAFCRVVSILLTFFLKRFLRFKALVKESIQGGAGSQMSATQILQKHH